MAYIGSHISISNGLLDAAKTIRKVGGNVMQIYLYKKNKLIHIQDKELKEFKKYITENKIQVVIHSSYMLNIARDWTPYSWWVHNILEEFKYAHKMGAYGIVMHFGKQLNLTKAQAYNNMYTFILHMLKKTNYKTKIILETTAGQGTEMCYKLEDLAHFYKKFSKNPNKLIRKNVKICIDTCHLFAAGYDIRDKKKVEKYLETFEELIGLNKVILIHLNDSYKDLGERVDRHQPLGHGKIGYVGLIEFFKFFKERQVLIVLETPGSNYEREIAMLENI